MKLAELRLLLAAKIRNTEFAGRSYFAGGSVRDELLGRNASKLDADIVVELPNGGVRLARYLQQALPTTEPQVHRAFGTASAFFGEIQLDFVMTRSEKYAPASRHPRVKFAPLATDCQRRDFTINALYQEITGGKVLDPCGKGLNDLKHRTIRCVRDPEHSFTEDPLRMLRALRFALVFGFEIEPDTLAAIISNAPLVLTLSRKRCRNELDRLEASLAPTSKPRWLTLLKETGIAAYLEQRIAQDL